MLPLDIAPLAQTLAPLLLVVAGLVAAPTFGVGRPAMRLTVAVGVGLVVGNYLWWRLTVTVPWESSAGGLAFALFCLAVELFGLFDAVILYAALVRRRDRSAEADRLEAGLRALPREQWPAVDLLIATYNESLEVLEKTIVGALALDWPNLNVWVADDGRRPWLQDYCRGKGAGYITRPDNTHAKAGNINHALKVTRAPFVAVFDADFIPQRGFLTRTMGFFEDPKIGIVQIPHSFYNHDPLQQNLAMRDAMPDDQRFFFEAIMPGRDGWDAAFCCGSNSVTRRAAFEAAGGGLPTGSITEDMLLTLALLRQGFITRYLNEPLAFGLAPESLAAFFVQRARWARGAMQILFLKEGPLGPGLALRHRLFFLPTAWLSQCLMMLTALIAPLIFLFLDIPPLVGVTPESAMFYLVPMVAAQVGGIVLLGGGRYYPLAAQVLGTFQSFRLLPVILKTLVKPHGHAFKVTPKGADALGGGFEREIFIAAIGLMMLTFAGLIINAIPDWRIVAQGALVPMVAFWCGINIVVLFLAAMLCLGMPANRAEERFAIDEPIALWRRDSNVVWVARSINLSLSGIAVDVDGLPDGEKVKVRLRGAGSLEGVVARSRDGMTGIAFTSDRGAVRDRLIIRLFTAGRNTAMLKIPAWQATRALLTRIWTAEMRSAQVTPVVAKEPRVEKLSAATRVVNPQDFQIRRKAAQGG
jgi:cellulose synthase (UDP-forming)